MKSGQKSENTTRTILLPCSTLTPLLWWRGQAWIHAVQGAVRVCRQESLSHRSKGQPELEASCLVLFLRIFPISTVFSWGPVFVVILKCNSEC